jgi:hypothetical protein
MVAERFRFERVRRSKSTDLARRKTPRRWARDTKSASWYAANQQPRGVEETEDVATLGLTESFTPLSFTRDVFD